MLETERGRLVQAIAIGGNLLKVTATCRGERSTFENLPIDTPFMLKNHMTKLMSGGEALDM